MESQAARLAHIVEAVEPVLARIGEEQSMAPVLPSGWSRKELIAHLIDSASNNHQRFVRASQQDSLDFPEYDQTGNVAVQAPQQAPWPVLVALWTNYNRYLSHIIARLPAQKLQTVCRIGKADPVILSFLVDDYIVHLEHHLKQIGIPAAGV
jgi:Mycothiol maleylpyruvate isomerase N-terminal domain